MSRCTNTLQALYKVLNENVDSLNPGSAAKCLDAMKEFQTYDKEVFEKLLCVVSKYGVEKTHKVGSELCWVDA